MEQKLFAGFDPVTAEAWKKRLEQDLKGITFEDLSVCDRNGITVHPFYTKEDLLTQALPLSCSPGWDICSRVEVMDAGIANKEALEALEHGASGLCFVLHQETDPAALLQDIQLPFIYSCFVFTSRSRSSAAAFSAYIRDSWPADRALTAYCSLDIIGAYLAAGNWQVNEAEDQQQYRSFLTDTAGLPALCVDTTLFHHAGANTVYELACSLALINEYLHLLDQEGLLAEQHSLHISLATDTSFFEQIAKLRALRRLLPLLYQPYAIDLPLHLHAVTSDVYRAPFDSYSNLLRDTIAGMAAVAGGANSLYTRPFDAKGVSAFSRRMSRNQQLIFKEESYLDKVADVAAGSYYVETLTAQIGEQAWDLFRKIEEQGGLIASFAAGTIKEQINLQAEQLVADYRSGKRVLTGINKFPNPADPPQPIPDLPAEGPGLAPLNLSQQLLHG